MKTCPIENCDAEIHDDRLLCSFHWRQVSKQLQDTIWLLYRQGKPRKGYAEACLNAVSQVNERVKRRS